MKGISRTYTVLGLVLTVTISHCFSAQASQPQGPVKESQKVEQSTEERNKLTSQLFQAIQSNNPEQAKELAAQGAYVNVRTNNGDTFLTHAIKTGELPLVEALISGGADVNARDRRGSTPLHSAALGGHKEVVELLIASGANVNAKDGRGNTPLDLAIQRGHIEIVKLFLQDKAGFSAAFSSAIQSGNNEVVKLIIGLGVDVNIKDEYGLTPLHYAVEAGHKEIVVMLLEHNASVDIQDNAGRTPMHYAAEANYWKKDRRDLSVEMIRLLKNSGFNIDAQDNNGWTPLHYAAHNRKLYLIEDLLMMGADVDVVDIRGRTPFVVMQERISDMGRKFGSEVMKTSPGAKALRNDLSEASGWLHNRGCTYFIAPYGDDANSGKSQSPLRTITAAVELVKPSDTIIVRGGTYSISSAIDIDVSGEQSNPIRLEAYPKETPVFDFAKAKGKSISITGAYWHIKGLVITNTQRPLQIHGSNAHHNVLEEIVAFGNQDIGICISADETAHNLILNCDAHSNFDFVTSGNGGDGFCVPNSVGRGNVLIGNRSWNNADDGYDLWWSNNAVRLERCYSWRNGENIWNYPLFGGDGNGFKLGGGAGRHVLINCIAWNHRASGFDSNGNTEGVMLRNCTGWDNIFSNYCFQWGGGVTWEDMILRNNVSYGSNNSIKARVDSEFNSWDAAVSITLTDDDFLSLDDSQMSAPRNPDGSIPQNDFLKLAPGSAAIDKGADIGMPFVGARPDLGAFEYDPNETSEGYVKMLHQAVRDHDVKQIEQLLAQGEGINDKDWLGYAPLHWAVYFGYSDLIELLISKGADPDVQSDTGRYALEIARAMAYPELEALLRKLGAKAGDTSTNEGPQETKAAEEQKSEKKLSATAS